MEINNLVFYDNLASIDVHGLDRAATKMYIKDFIDDSIKLKRQFIMVVHGKGSGILKVATHETLKRHKKVLEYKQFYNNLGVTIIRLDV